MEPLSKEEIGRIFVPIYEEKIKPFGGSICKFLGIGGNGSYRMI